MSTKESLKIFVDAYLLNKEFQGTKTYIQELYKEFSRRNPNIQIYFGCFQSDELIKEYKDFKNIHLVFYKKQSRLKRMLFEIPKLIDAHQFDFAHFQYVIPFRRNAKTKYIVTIHDILFNDFRDEFSKSYRVKRNSLFKSSAKKSDFLCTVSQYSSDRIKQIYKIKKEIYITPNGVKSEYFDQYDKEKEATYISEKYQISNYLLYVSRIEPRKNQQLIIRLFEKLPDDVQLVFIGERTLKNPELDNQLASLNPVLKKRIHFFKGIEDHDLLSFIRAAKVFVYPSKAEGFGIPPLEAGAARIPVVCSNTTAMSDFTFFDTYHINFLNEKDVLLSLQKILSKTEASQLKKISKEIQNNYSWARASNVLEFMMGI